MRARAQPATRRVRAGAGAAPPVQLPRRARSPAREPAAGPPAHARTRRARGTRLPAPHRLAPALACADCGDDSSDAFPASAVADAGGGTAVLVAAMLLLAVAARPCLFALLSFGFRTVDEDFVTPAGTPGLAAGLR